MAHITKALFNIAKILRSVHQWMDPTTTNNNQQQPTTTNNSLTTVYSQSGQKVDIEDITNINSKILNLSTKKFNLESKINNLSSRKTKLIAGMSITALTTAVTAAAPP